MAQAINKLKAKNDKKTKQLLAMQQQIVAKLFEPKTAKNKGSKKGTKRKAEEAEPEPSEYSATSSVSLSGDAVATMTAHAAAVAANPHVTSSDNASIGTGSSPEESLTAEDPGEAPGYTSPPTE